jgi:uncharacterized oxidoreductase
VAQLEEFVVVTGASRGIGQQITKALVQRGQKVIAVARTTESLADLETAYSANIVAFALDLADPQSCEDFATYVAETYSIIGIINNAGVQNSGPLTAHTAAMIDSEIRTNLTAPAILAARLLPFLPDGRGFIVNVTSGLGVAPKSDAAVYCATKAGLRNLTRGIENQVENGHKIKLIDVVFPLVETDMTCGRGSGKISSTAAAQAVIRAIDAKMRIAWVGKSALLNLVNRFSPALAHTIMRKM